MTKFIDTIKELMSLLDKEDEDFSDYRDIIDTLSLRAKNKPANEVTNLEDLAYGIKVMLNDTECDGWLKESKACFSRDDLYDMMEAGLIHEPCRGEDGYIYFCLTDE